MALRASGGLRCGGLLTVGTQGRVIWDSEPGGALGTQVAGS